MGILGSRCTYVCALMCQLLCFFAPFGSAATYVPLCANFYAFLLPLALPLCCLLSRGAGVLPFLLAFVLPLCCLLSFCFTFCSLVGRLCLLLLLFCPFLLALLIYLSFYCLVCMSFHWCDGVGFGCSTFVVMVGFGCSTLVCAPWFGIVCVLATFTLADSMLCFRLLYTFCSVIPPATPWSDSQWVVVPCPQWDPANCQTPWSGSQWDHPPSTH